jgi:hypothetical protein
MKRQIGAFAGRNVREKMMIRMWRHECGGKHYVDNPLRPQARSMRVGGLMNDLLLELENVSARREILEVLRGEFAEGGMLGGRLAIGEIHAAPEMVYFLWHESGEAPVSMLIRQENLKSEDGARDAARDFLVKWQKRMG